MRSSGKQFGLVYLDADEVGRYLEEYSGYVLSVIGFGRPISLPATASAPLWVDIPVLGVQDNSFEVWASDAPVTACEHQGICGTTDGKVLFASLSLQQRADETMEMLAEQAYMRIF